MKLSIVFLLGLFVCVSSAYAQKITAIQGKAFSAPPTRYNPITEPDLLSLPDGSILVFKRGKQLTPMSDRTSFLYICDKSMNEVQKERKADLPKGFDGCNLLAFNGKYYFVCIGRNESRKLSKTEKEYDSYCSSFIYSNYRSDTTGFAFFKVILVEINISNLTMGNEIPLHTAELSSSIGFGRNNWAIWVSPDSKRLAFVGREEIIQSVQKISKSETKVTANQKLHVSWFDKNLKLEKQQTYDNKLALGIKKKMPGFLTEEGKLFIQSTGKTGKNARDQVVISITPDQSDLTIEGELKPELKSGSVYFGNGSTFTEDYFITAGLSFNPSAMAYDGYVYRRFNLKDRTEEVIQTIPVEKMLIDAVNKTKQQSKDYAKAFTELQKLQNETAIVTWGGNRRYIGDDTEVLIHDDMSATIITEIAATRVVGSQGAFVHHLNFDVIVTHIDPSGTIAWTKRVPIWQDLTVGFPDSYNGVFPAYHEGNLYLFHNRCAGTGKKNEDNICELNDGNLNNADIICTSIDPAGKVSTQTVYNNKPYGEMFAPRNSMQLSNGRIILYSFDGGKQRLVEAIVK